MSNQASVKSYIQAEACVFRSAVSESLVQTIAGSVNYLLDNTALNYGLSSSCGLFVGPGPGYQPVTNLSVTITTSGRPVYIGMIDDGTTDGSSTYSYITYSSSTTSFVLIKRGSTTIVAAQSGANAPVSSISTVDIVAAGTYTYTIHAFSNTTISHAKLFVREF